MMTRTRLWIPASALALAISVGAPQARAASEVGVAAAVNPQATGHLSSGGQRTIVIGEKLTFKERVQTSEGGLVQVLLLDGSTFTVGPNSDLVIDEFVYNPDTGSGKLVASFSKGVMRFVGGKLSKNEGGVQVRTPVGLMGIRGGVANVSVDPVGSSFFSLLYGEELTLQSSDGDLNRLYERGYAIDISGGLSGPIEIRKVTDDEAKMFISQLSGTAGTSGGAVNQPTNQNVQQSGVSGQGSENDPDAVTPNSRPDAVLSENAENLHQNTLAANTIIANRDMRVLSTGAAYSVNNGGGYTVIDPSGKGIVGATAGQDLTNADQQANFAVNALLNAKATLIQGPITVPYPILQGTYILTGAPSPFGKLTGTVMVGSNADFLFYRLFADVNVNGLSKPVYIIDGNPTPEAKLIGTGDVQRYKLGQDVVQQLAIPFVTTGSAGAPDPQGTFVSDLFLVRPDGERYNDDTNAAVKGTPVALQASLQISGSGAGQYSTLVLGVGNTADDTFRLGSSRTESGDRSIAFSGNFDLVKGANDTEMFGPNGEYFVVGPDLVEGKVFVDTPDTAGALSLEDLVSATIHVATFDSQTQLSALTRSLDGLTGFAAGMVELVGTSDIPIPYRSTSSGDLVMAFDPANNTLGGELTVRDVSAPGTDLTSLQVAFGDGVGENEGSDGPSAMVDDDTFAAGPNTTAERTVLVDPSVPAAYTATDAATGAYVVSSNLVGNVLPDGRTPCECKFLEWGYWGARPTFDRGEGDNVTTNVHVGTWAAGNVAREVELPTSGLATYDGHAVGNVTRDIGNTGSDVRQYLAAGDLNLTWNFATRGGTMTISDFDGMTLTGAMTGTNLGVPTANPNAFAGALSDGANMSGFADGAFVSPVVADAPQGVLGAFDVRGTVATDLGADGLSAGGVFVGQRAIP